MLASVSQRFEMKDAGYSVLLADLPSVAQNLCFDIC